RTNWNYHLPDRIAMSQPMRARNERSWGLCTALSPSESVSWHYHPILKGWESLSPGLRGTSYPGVVGQTLSIGGRILTTTILKGWESLSPGLRGTSYLGVVGQTLPIGRRVLRTTFLEVDD